MHELLAQVFVHVRGVWRYRWIALALAWVVAIAGWVYVSKIPDEYRSSARVYVDTNSMLRPLLRGLTIQPDLVQRVSLMSRMLLTRPNLEKIVRMNDLDLGMNTAREKEQLITSLGQNIRINGDRGNASLFSLAYENRNPETAKRVVQSLVSIFIEEALVGDQLATSTAQDFLDQEIQEYETRLVDAEKQLADFQKEYAGLLPGSEGGYYTKLEAAKVDLKNAELALQEAIRQREELSYQLQMQNDSTISNDTDFGSEWIEDPRIASYQAKLDDLLLRYTEKHPDVVELRRLIAEIKEKDRQRAKANPASSAMNVQADTVYGSMQLVLNEVDAQVAAMKARVEDYTKRVKDLEEKIDSIPTIEAKLKQLNRDYGTILGQHNALLERRESARLSTQVEKSSEGVKFRVIDPPYVPMKPSAPNRPALAATVLLLALAVGVGAAFAVDLLRPVFDDRRVLYRATGLPVLGAVALVQTHAQRRRDRLMLVPFFALTAGLVVAMILVTAGLPSLRNLI